MNEIVKLRSNGEIVVYLGDNIDIRNVSRKELAHAKQTVLWMKKHTDMFIMGNHELDVTPAPNFYKHDGVLFTHGDFISWDLEKVKAFRSKPKSAGWFKRNILIPVIDFARHVYEPMITDEFKKRLVSYAIEYDCHTVVMGHRHPSKRIDVMIDGYRCIILPRGINKVEL